MQNLVYRTQVEALQAPFGQFELKACSQCGFAFNQAFDPDLLTYDRNYDNQVVSQQFADYYHEIATHLIKRHELSQGLICEIGCGKGQFLDLFCQAGTGIQGIGVDPSCDPRTPTPGLPVTLIQDQFRPEQLNQPPALTICRHTLEHIPDPLAFLAGIQGALVSFGNVPLFVEVPDLDWILDQNAFWDFCYEHCNYFTKASLGNLLVRSGFQVEEIAPAFNGQYLWAHARSGPTLEPNVFSSDIHLKLANYSTMEDARIQARATEIEGTAQSGPVVIWGMATKGVIFSNLADPNSRCQGGVDSNPNKQGCFTPGTGLEIHSPEWLKQFSSTRLTIVVMNPNYYQEIQAQCKTLGVEATFLLP